MKKNDIDTQYENAILLAIAIADGYFPVDEHEYKKELNKKIKTCGIDNYKEALNFALAGLPQFVGTDAIYAGKLTLANSERDYIDFALGNNKQFSDKYNNNSAKIIETFIKQNLNDKEIDVNAVLTNKFTLYDFLNKYVIPKMLNDRIEILRSNNKDNVLKNFQDKKVLDILFDLKFDAMKRRAKCHGNGEYKYFGFTHGMIDSVVDLYASILSAYDEKDIDTRSISPYTLSKNVNRIDLAENEFEDLDF